MSLGFTEIALIVVVIILLFGAKRIPELARSIGKAHLEYKKAKEALKKESEEIVEVVEENAKAQDAKEQLKDGSNTTKND